MPTELPSGFTNNNRNTDDDLMQHTPRRPPDEEPPKDRTEKNKPEHDEGAFRLATIAGIPLRLHWTFLAFLIWIGIRSIGQNQAGGVLFVLSLFGCVTLHEFGHALAAARYGVKTRSIVLYPIGGVASLETMPRPRQELWIALAGPAVNVVIAAILYAVLRATGTPLVTQVGSANFLAQLFWTNIFLVGFNMLPAFPMDGGRVLRAILARFNNDEVKATRTAAAIGQFFAVLMGLYGLFAGAWALVFIAVFVYLGAAQEANAFAARELIHGHLVSEAMMREFHTLPVGTTFREAAEVLLRGSQQDFPVVHGGEVVGVLSRANLLQGMAAEGADGYIAGSMEREFAAVPFNSELETVLQRMSGGMTSPILVFSDNTFAQSSLVGMLTQENLIEFLTVAQIRQRSLQR
jgi:Zn-dependent protease